MKRLVCSEEKESVESTEIKIAQSKAGHQARSQLRKRSTREGAASRPGEWGEVGKRSEVDMKEIDSTIIVNEE